MGRAPFLIALCLFGCKPTEPSLDATSKTLSVPQTARATYFTSDGEVVTVNTGNENLLDSIRYVALNSDTPIGWVYLFDRTTNVVTFVPRDRWLALTFQHRSARWSATIVAERARVLMEQREESFAASGQKRKREAIGDGVVDIVEVDFSKRIRAVVWNQPTHPTGVNVQPCAAICVGCTPSFEYRLVDPKSDEAIGLRQYFGFSSQDFTVCGMTAETIVSRETKRDQ